MVKRGWTAFYRKYGNGRFPVSFTQAHLDAGDVPDSVDLLEG
jgi:hypothetical protein